jgi:hypothetical protein
LNLADEATILPAMKIAICLPVHGDTRAAFTLSLSKMLMHTAFGGWSRQMPGVPLTLDTFMGSGGVVALVRERLVDTAERWGADFILWLDSDQTFPPDTLIRLAAAGEPVIGANIPRRTQDARPTADVLDTAGRPAPLYTTREKAAAGLVEPVHQMGLGVCLTAMEALRALPRPLFDELREDHGLMRKLRDAGYSPKVDHALSAQVGHVGVFTWTNEHSIEAMERQGGQVAIEVAGGTVVRGRVGG